jgi:hypothetical protein
MLEPNQSAWNALVGGVQLLGASIVLWSKLSSWLPQIIGGIWLGALKSAIGLLTSRDLAPPFAHTPPVVAGETLIYLSVAAVLLPRFDRYRISPVDKLALLVFVLATVAEMVYEPLPIAMLIGLCALLLAQIRHRLTAPSGQPELPPSQVSPR